MRPLPFLLASALLLSISACSKPEDAVEKVRENLQKFRASPNSSTQSAVEESFTQAEQAIARLQSRGESARAEALERDLQKLCSEFAAAKVARAVNEAMQAVDGFGQAIREAGKSFGDALKKSATNE